MMVASGTPGAELFGRVCEELGAVLGGDGDQRRIPAAAQSLAAR